MPHAPWRNRVWLLGNMLSLQARHTKRAHSPEAAASSAAAVADSALRQRSRGSADARAVPRFEARNRSWEEMRQSALVELRDSRQACCNLLWHRCFLLPHKHMQCNATMPRNIRRTVAMRARSADKNRTTMQGYHCYSSAQGARALIALCRL